MIFVTTFSQMQLFLTALTCLIHFRLLTFSVFVSEMGGGCKDISWSLITSYPESDDPSLSMSWEATGPTIFRIKTKGKAPPVPSPALAYIPVKPWLKIQAVPAHEV